MNHGSGINPAATWSNVVRSVPAIVDRLRGVLVENYPALKVIKYWDKERNNDRLFYIDPPYVREKLKKDSGQYLFDMDYTDHDALIRVLQGVTGSVVLSGYPNDLYNDMLQGWTRFDKDHYAGGHAGGREPRVECLWINEVCRERIKQGVLGL